MHNGREFPTFDPLSSAEAGLPRLQLLAPLIDTVMGANELPGITHITDSVLTCLHLIREAGRYPHDPKSFSAKSGAMLYNLLTHTYGDLFGLITPESLYYQPLPENKIYPIAKFDKAVAIADGWHKAGLKIGIFPGSLDAPHLLHAFECRNLCERVDRVIVSVDPGWLVKALKDRPDDPRPRISSTDWKMWQMSLPTVDMVIESPIDMNMGTENLNTQWSQIYSSLHITAIASGEDNPHLKDYRAHMKTVGGEVVVSKKFPQILRFITPTSATDRMKLLARSDFGGDQGSMQDSEVWKKIASESRIYETRLKHRWGD